MKHSFTAIISVSVFFVGLTLAGMPGYASDFRVTTFVGECAVKMPSASEFSPVAAETRYPWGSRLRTEAESHIVVELAEGGICRVMPNAVMSIARDSRNKRLLRVSIEEGAAQISLNELFRQQANLEVETPVLVATPVGTRFSLGMGKKPELDMVVATVSEGTLVVSGKHHPVPVFDIPTLSEGSQVSVSAARNRTWYRIKNHRGKFVVLVPGEGNSMRPVTLEEGQTIRIVIAPAQDDISRLHITVLIIDEDGKTTVEAWTTQRSVARPAPEDLLYPSEFPVPTTTTTTIPSPTPVGER